MVVLKWSSLSLLLLPYPSFIHSFSSHPKLAFFWLCCHFPFISRICDTKNNVGNYFTHSPSPLYLALTTIVFAYFIRMSYQGSSTLIHFFNKRKRVIFHLLHSSFFIIPIQYADPTLNVQTIALFCFFFL